MPAMATVSASSTVRPIWVAAAKERGCDIALYGHTHESDVHEEEGVLVVNPGCMTYYTPAPSYCYLVIVGKKAVATVVEVR